jgi:membrane-associated protease RseP (regulator of RpoE activity)
MYVAIFVGSIIVAVMFHEFGHYATAKAFGMKVERFFFGFGPTLWSFNRGETEYGVKAIPAGGFVKITGMSAFEEVAEEDRGRTFHQQAAWKRAIVLAAGSATHFVVAVPLIFLALAAAGLPFPTNTVAVVTEHSPAQAAGLQPGDTIVAVDGRPTTDFEEIRGEVAARPGETLVLALERDGDSRTLQVTLPERDPAGERRGFLGVGAEVGTRRVAPGEAAVATFRGDLSVVRLTQLTVWGLGQAFHPESLAAWLGQVADPGPRQPEGPMSLVGAGQLAQEFGRQGDVFAVLLILAQINIVIGLLNMLPLPPLDGGHLAVLAAEESVNQVRRVRGRPTTWRVDPAVLTPIAVAVILFFVAISVTALYIDIVKPASGLLE